MRETESTPKRRPFVHATVSGHLRKQNSSIKNNIETSIQIIF